MYKIFKITYSNIGDFSYFYYISSDEKHIIDNSEKYKKYLTIQKDRGGSIWIHEIDGMIDDFLFENLQYFDIDISIKAVK